MSPSPKAEEATGPDRPWGTRTPVFFHLPVLVPSIFGGIVCWPGQKSVTWTAPLVSCTGGGVLLCTSSSCDFHFKKMHLLDTKFGRTLAGGDWGRGAVGPPGCQPDRLISRGEGGITKWFFQSGKEGGPPAHPPRDLPAWEPPRIRPSKGTSQTIFGNLCTRPGTPGGGGSGPEDVHRKMGCIPVGISKFRSVQIPYGQCTHPTWSYPPVALGPGYDPREGPGGGGQPHGPIFMLKKLAAMCKRGAKRPGERYGCCPQKGSKLPTCPGIFEIRGRCLGKKSLPAFCAENF